LNKNYLIFKIVILLCIFCIASSSISFVSFAEENLEIVSLTASKTEINRGESFILEWEVTGADWIIFEGPEKLPDMIFPLTGNYEFFPLKTTTYTLIAYTEETSVRKSITVTVLDNLDSVVIDDFSASEYTVSPDTEIELAWIVRNEESLEIVDSNGNNIDIDSEATSVIVKPLETTTYTLIVIANDIIEEASITINVEKSEEISEVKINKFFADRTTIPEGGVAYLNWSVENAIEVTLDYLTDDWYTSVANSGSTMVVLYKSQTFELNATDDDGNTITATLTINVEIDEDTDDEKTQALISEFKSTSHSVASGEEFSIGWFIKNAIKANITDSNGTLMEISDLESGSISTSIDDTTSYILTAVGENGLKVTARITIEMKDTSEINILKFYASSYNVSMGELVGLTWEVENALGCFITTSDGEVLTDISVADKIYVTPNKTTTYKLVSYAVNQISKTSEITIEVNS
jgi:hypothetical protein